MAELIKEKDDGRLYCWNCRTTEVEVNATDSIYRLQCNRCHKHRLEKLRLEWMHTRENVLAGCQFCWDSYSFQKKLEVHKCPIGVPFQCRLCAYQLNSCTSLKVHLNVAHGLKGNKLRTYTEAKPFKCNFCKKSFTQKCNLSMHLRIHTGEKPFKCKICESVFAQSSNLTYHLKTHTGEKPFECNICKTAFAHKRQLSTHLMSHTGEKPYKCTICKKAFGQSADLKRHLRTHTGEKPFKCKICERGFAQPQDLTRHLKTHTRKKCNICKKAFAREGKLCSHLRNQRGEKPLKFTLYISNIS